MSINANDYLLFPSWLIRSKVHPTKQRVYLIERPKLIRTLDNHCDRALSLIHAPAGFGKSTLLASWRQELLKREFKVAWLSLDHEDNEPFQLLAYIAFALSEGGIDFQAAKIEDQSFFKDLSPRNFLSVINHVLEVHEDNVILILDDFENLDEDTVNEIIMPLIRYAPANLHIAIGSREEGKLKVTSLETQGLVLRIHAEDMRFTLEELNAFFDHTLPKKTIEHIYELTEGWPVTLQMLRNTISTSQDVDRIVIKLRDNDSLITNYLSEQIFSSLSNELQQFLLDISLIRGVSCKYIDYLRTQEDSIIFFNALKPISALILPLEKVEQTYQLHPLFREFLYGKLISTQPQRADQLHVRTADWLAERGHILQAVSHSIKGKDPQRAGKIIEDVGGVHIWLTEGITRLRAVMRLLDEKTVESSPSLMLIRCLIHTKDGKVSMARKDYDALTVLFDNVKTSLLLSEQAKVNHEMVMSESLLICYEGKILPAQLCDKINQNISRISHEDYYTLSYYYSALCLSSLQRGAFQQARGYAEKTMNSLKKINSIYGEIYLHFHLGNICFSEGKSEESEKHYQTSVNRTRQHFNDDKGMKLIATVLNAELKYELNYMKGLASFTRSIPKQLEEREAWFDIYAAGYITTSGIEYSRSGIEAATLILDHASIYSKTQGLTRLTVFLTLLRINLLIRNGDNHQAKDILETSNITIETYKNSSCNDIALREVDAAVYAITKLKIWEGLLNESLEILTYFSDCARNNNHIKSYIRYEILLSFVYQKKNSSQDSYEHLNQALYFSHRSGYVRSFLDEGNQMTELLRKYINEANIYSNDTTEHAKNMLHLFSVSTDVEQENPILSKRELEVMHQLSFGYSNKIIARNIDISENTVRFHLKNIFTKLHVDNRLQAVNVAKKTKLIKPPRH